MRSRTTVLIVIALLFATSASVANPAGQGDADRDYTCGGSCHGDPALSSPSDGTVTISVDPLSFSGTATAVHVTASGMSLSGNRLLGVFLLSSTSGNDDHPEDHGWNILQDPNGGTHNYVEVVVPPSGSVTLTWVMLAPEQSGIQTLFTEIHHGSNPNSNNWAYSALTRGYVVDVQPVPENLPGFAFDWTPETRVTGDDSPTVVRTRNTTSVSVQWMLEREWVPHDAEVTGESDEWHVMLPATIGDTRIQYQVTTSNGDFSIVQPWLTVATEPAAFDGEIWGARMQALAFGLLVMAFLLSLQARLSPWEGRPEFDHTEGVEAAETPPEPPGLAPADDYWSRLVSSEENPGWLWDPVEEEWVADPVAPISDSMNEIGTTGDARASSSAMEVKIGYLGSILMIVGPFLPVMTICVFVCVDGDYIGADWDRNGVLVLFIGLISLALIRFEKFKILAATSVIVLLLILDFINDIHTIISEPAYGAYVILVSSLLTGYASFRKW